ncbi:MAG: hypothetical protein HY748_06630 [Elusimicrobia bacterium]|nr:hypothetical protein [Elusimicrobiota bacterium]
MPKTWEPLFQPNPTVEPSSSCSLGGLPQSSPTKVQILCGQNISTR